MASRVDFDTISTANVKIDVGKKSWKGNKNSKKDTLLIESTPSDVITTHSLSAMKISDDEVAMSLQM